MFRMFQKDFGLNVEKQLHVLLAGTLHVQNVSKKIGLNVEKLLHVLLAGYHKV